MQELAEYIERGSYQDVLTLSQDWDDKQRREATRWIKAYWKEHKPKGVTLPAGTIPRWMCLVIAAIGAASDAKGALLVPLPHEAGTPLKWQRPWRVEGEARRAMLQALACRGREWVASYLEHSNNSKTRHLLFVDVCVALCQAFDLPLPEHEPFYTNWAEGVHSLLPTAFRNLTSLYPQTLQRVELQTAADGSLAVRLLELRANTPWEAAAAIPDWRALMASLLARPDAILALLGTYTDSQASESLSELIEQCLTHGLLDRATLTAQSIAALVRGDSVTAQRQQARLLLQAATDPAHFAAHAPTLCSLLASGHGSAAEAAQTLLRRVDQHQPLDGASFASACQMIFARKEKGLRNEQLAWATLRLRQYPEQTHATQEGLIAALAADDFSFQKKVVSTLLTHWSATPPGEPQWLLQQLAPYQYGMDAGLYAELAAALGAGAPRAQGGAEESAPAAEDVVLAETRPLRPFQVPPADAATLRELQARLGSEPTVELSEQVIAVALTLATQDRHALRLGLHSISSDYPVGLLQMLQQAAFGKDRPRIARYAHELLVKHGRDTLGRSPGWESDNGTRQLSAIAQLRFLEIALAILDGSPYPLISRPDYSNGALDCSTLVKRLATLAEDGTTAGPMDLLVALLRSSPPDASDLARLRAIGSAQALIAADFLAAGGLAQMRSRWQVVHENTTNLPRHSLSGWIGRKQPEVCVALQGLEVLPAIAPAPLRWSQGFTAEVAIDVWEFDLAEPLLTGIMPNHGEILAAFHLWGFRKACDDDNTSGGKATALALPVFLAARGPAGPALHLAVLFCLSANDAAARISGSDGLLELIAQGRYDSALACELAAVAVSNGNIKPGRLAKSLTQAVEAGAGRVLWSLVSTTVGSALALDTPPPGTPDLLALASSMAARQGLREHIAPLDTLVARKGSSKLLTEARRLHGLLTGAGA